MILTHKKLRIMVLKNNITSVTCYLLNDESYVNVIC